MNNDPENKHYLRQLTMEAIERTIRFYIHLEKTEDLFYSGMDGNAGGIRDKLLFMQSFKACLIRLLKICVGLTQMGAVQGKEDNAKKIVLQFREIIKALGCLHMNYLGHLPRPREPIEIQRFCRIIDKHLLNIGGEAKPNDESPKMSIYVNEEIGEETFANDPLAEFKEKELTTIDSAYEELRALYDFPLPLKAQEKLQASTLHITIPRVEASNPCRWPTLIHEVAHHLIKNELFEGKPIEEDFLAKLNPSEASEIQPLLGEFNLKGWLNEIWCDLFAALCIGPSFWFSQYSVFISQCSDRINKTHPPAFFRLHLIKWVLQHKADAILWPELNDSMRICNKTLMEIDGTSAIENDFPWLDQVLVLMKEYFAAHFFESLSTELSGKIKPLIKFTSNLNSSTISSLVESLSDGLPIPSYRLVSNGTYSETPSSVQEILLSAWIYRNCSLKDQILEEISQISTNDDDSIFIKSIDEKIINRLSRFDFSVIRSIQVSEWFEILIPSENKEAGKVLEIPKEKKGSVLVDWEIKELIENNQLKIIPIIDFKTQLGSTSFDIRLGTSFQLFYQNKDGIFDSTEENAQTSLRQSSVLRDLDFLEGLTLFPGQFVLGHSMEYLRFPKHIAAEVEGRSSFARLGIEIHMTAGFVDPGYEGVLTYEIYNAGANPVRLYPSTRIAQLRFFTTSFPERSYNLKPERKYSGLLAHNNSLQFKDPEIKRIREAKQKLQSRKIKM